MFITQSGECIYEKDQPSGEVYFITYGYVEVFAPNKVDPFMRLPEGNIFGEKCLISNDPSPYYYRAAENKSQGFYTQTSKI